MSHFTRIRDKARRGSEAHHPLKRTKESGKTVLEVKPKI